MKNITKKLMLLAIGLSAGALTSQTTERMLSVPELFRLTKENHPTLRVARYDVAVERQKTEVAKNAMLPKIDLAVQAYYLGDAYLIDRDFSDSKKLEMPHFGNNYSLEATELLWKGGKVRNSIQAQTLKEQLAGLSYEASEQNIKLLVLGYYLDISKILNQIDVYKKNIELAEQRLRNINKFYKQGMVTRNDIIRAELQLSNLQLALNVAENNRLVLNNQLTEALGLSNEIMILPDRTLEERVPDAVLLEPYIASIQNHPSLDARRKLVELQDKAIEIAKADKVPAVSAFAGGRMAKPIISTIPPHDMYNAGYQVGLSLNFNVDELYKSPKREKQLELERERAEAQRDETERLLNVAVNAAFIKYNEAITQRNTLEKNMQLAEENYRIIQSKYNNQLAIILDVIDASNAKLDAELQHANAEINVVNQYYRLLKESGTLNN
ncbi:TolC family protein [Cruoricaptor ignavus]|uniref:TolC family protein n=1 Tax=Cruoricaptor ignavus TaxID=1118202 RepID=A0A7M1T225_9FLAO|nr:TolC family protein [Cruoricaptor ignavus]QOR73879.1 TolC family protein [Cruoricaptor ignavus]